MNKKIITSLAATMLLSGSVFADNASDIAEIKKQIAELMKKAQMLEAKSAELDKKSIALEKKSKALEEKSLALEEQSQILIDETSDLKSGFEYTTVDMDKSFSGLSAGASKVYYSKSPLSIGGYGEMYYSHAEKEGAANTDTVDVYRFVPYIGYKFTDDIILNVELEFEHGGADSDNTSGGYVIVEFMYLDFLLNKNYNFRLGHMLMPMGLVNQKHEPTLFTTVQRPNTSKYLIPSTWHESGLMMFGELSEGWDYKIAAVTGLDDSKTGSKWLRSARGGSYKQTDTGTEQLGLGFTGRLDYSGINGLEIGASTYLDSSIQMWDIHADYRNGPFRAYGVYSESYRDNEEAVAAGNGETKAKGGFINLGYDVMSFFPGYNKQMPVFIQYESISPQDELADGSSVSPIDTTTFGFNFFPHEQVVLKLDYAMQEQDSVKTDTVSASIGFVF